METTNNETKLLEYFELVGKLKHIKRTGWVLRQVQDPECIAAHMYRMAMMTFLLSKEDGVDKTRCMQLALVHDLPECLVGDLTPHCGVSVEEKHKREDEAMKKLSELSGVVGTELYQLYKEYEEQKTPEAKLVKELDRFDMVLQAFEYEKAENQAGNLQEFFDGVEGKICSPVVSSWMTQLLKNRKEYKGANARGNT